MELQGWCKCIFNNQTAFFTYVQNQFCTPSSTSLPQIYVPFSISNLLFHTVFSFFFPTTLHPGVPFSSVTSASCPRPPSPFSVRTLPASYASSDCQPTSEPRGGSTGIKDGTAWPIFSMPQYTEDIVWPCQNQSHFHSSFNMSVRALERPCPSTLYVRTVLW